MCSYSQHALTGPAVALHSPAQSTKNKLLITTIQRCMATQISGHTVGKQTTATADPKEGLRLTRNYLL